MKHFKRFTSVSFLSALYLFVSVSVWAKKPNTIILGNASPASIDYSAVEFLNNSKIWVTLGYEVAIPRLDGNVKNANVVNRDAAKTICQEELRQVVMRTAIAGNETVSPDSTSCIPKLETLTNMGVVYIAEFKVDLELDNNGKWLEYDYLVSTQISDEVIEARIKQLQQELNKTKQGFDSRHIFETISNGIERGNISGSIKPKFLGSDDIEVRMEMSLGNSDYSMEGPCSCKTRVKPNQRMKNLIAYNLKSACLSELSRMLAVLEMNSYLQKYSEQCNPERLSGLPQNDYELKVNIFIPVAKNVKKKNIEKLNAQFKARGFY